MEKKSNYRSYRNGDIFQSKYGIYPTYIQELVQRVFKREFDRMEKFAQRQLKKATNGSIKCKIKIRPEIILFK